MSIKNRKIITPFEYKKWSKIFRKNTKNRDFKRYYFINYYINKEVKNGYLKNEEEFKKINERTEKINKAINNYKGGNLEFLALEKAVDSFYCKIKNGYYAEHYKKELKKEVEKLKRETPQKYVYVNDEYILYKELKREMEKAKKYIEKENPIILASKKYFELIDKKYLPKELKKELLKIRAVLLKELLDKNIEYNEKITKEDRENAKKIRMELKE